MDFGFLETVVVNFVFIVVRGSIDGSSVSFIRDRRYLFKFRLFSFFKCEGFRESLDLEFRGLCFE